MLHYFWLLFSLLLTAARGNHDLRGCQDIDPRCALVQEISDENTADSVRCKDDIVNKKSVILSTTSVQIALAQEMCDNGFDHYCPVACDTCPGTKTPKFKKFNRIEKTHLIHSLSGFKFSDFLRQILHCHS